MKTIEQLNEEHQAAREAYWVAEDACIAHARFIESDEFFDPRDTYTERHKAAKAEGYRLLDEWRRLTREMDRASNACAHATNRAHGLQIANLERSVERLIETVRPRL